MRRVLPLLLLLLLTTCRDPTVRWYILAGQSNMVGNSDQAKLPGRVGAVLRGNSSLSSVFWEPRVLDPFVWSGLPAGNLDRTSMAPSFVGHTPWVDHLITAAIGSQCLATDVDHENAGSWNPDTGFMYTRMLEMWELAGFPVIEEVLWLQGECESGSWHSRKLAQGQTDQWQYDNSYAQYKAALMDLADHVWADLGAPLRAAPISLRQCLYPPNDPQIDPTCPTLGSPSQKAMGVHDATIDAAAEHPHILPGPIHDDVYSSTVTGHTWDVHELGRRWAALVAP